jgi:hypothetical protein
MLKELFKFLFGKNNEERNIINEVFDNRISNRNVNSAPPVLTDTVKNPDQN